MSADHEREILRIAGELFELAEEEWPRRLEALALPPEIDAGVREMLGCAERDDLFDDPRLGSFVGALIEEEHRRTTSGAGESSSKRRTVAMPERIGPYRIVRELGRGGMGVVYEAEQVSPRRRVALKVILPHLATEELRARFQREAEVLGQLQHVGIAHIYEAVLDEEGGEPFFAMEYIDGDPLDTYARTNELDTRGRLALVARICDAVQHAHMKGILHRDLKPGNILVVEGAVDETASSDSTSSTGTDRGRTRRSGTTGGTVAQPKILDFGIARVTDADLQTVTLQTEVGQIMGTLAYMSPEQLTGDSIELDTRCDVYALGVILFELLTGKLPHEVRGRSIADAARVVQDTEAPSAGDHDTRLRGDISTILSKALAKERERRYAGAAELAADIRRFLNDEPIEARPTSAMYQLTKFVRRHRALTTTAALAAVSTIVLTIWALLNAGIANENARLATERERELSRLSDRRELRVLDERMDELWPVTIENGRLIDGWVEDAETLIARIPEHEATLEGLRALATGEGGETLDFGGDKRTLWWFETLESLIRDLHVFADEGVYGRTIGAMRSRREVARRVEARTTGPDVEEAWARTRDEIRSSDLYSDLDLLPQPGLVPLGADPESGLQEFWHVQSGARPVRDEASGRYVIDGDAGVVLVLLPGGEFYLGSSAKRGQPNYARGVIFNEVPPVQLSLDPFFCSKYEITQGQWERTMGRRPNSGLQGTNDEDFPRHPVALVDWPTSVEGARRMGMLLPTEAQWEYACRAGTQGAWFVGQRAPALVDVANLADATYLKVIETQLGGEDWDDGFLGTAPVGVLGPNAFGLHDVHGNVWEWTRDQYQPEYVGMEFDPSDGARGVYPEYGETRVLRGGSFQAPASFARSAVRSRLPLDHTDIATGLRTVLPIVVH